MRLCYKCHYDGNECGKEIPNVNSEGTVIEPQKFTQNENNRGCWKVCKDCNRNYSMSGGCYGELEIRKEESYGME